MGSKVHPPMVAMTAVNTDTESSDESCGLQHEAEAGRVQEEEEEEEEESREATSVMVSCLFLHSDSLCPARLLTCTVH